MEVIKRAVSLHRPDKTDALDVLSKVGGFDLAGMAGVFLGGAALHMPVIIDGFISGVAALVAAALCPSAREYMLASHKSKEPAAHLVLEALGKDPFLTCDMSLGEGTGAVTLFPFWIWPARSMTDWAALKKKRWKPTFRWTDEGEVMLHLITGGSGSGKSAFAEQCILNLGEAPRIYIATMYPFDEESRRRIARHREMRREKRFTTIECFTGLSGVQITVWSQCASGMSLESDS